ncbi:MAG: hypothetical protein MAG471_00396 [Acidimicrobiaceae bacterium]|nr:hypothetical protein [Acidimicrobiaceae bacterium]
MLSPDSAAEIVVSSDAFEDVVEVTTTAAPEPSATLPSAPVASSTTTAAPEQTTTTTTTEAPRTTVPLAEDEISPGAKLLDALDRFNSCLSTEGHTWIGMPSMEAGADAPENNSEYVGALILCNSRTGISTVFEEFQASRTGLEPDEIEQQNKDFIDLTDCLRGKGWEISELTPDENGLLSPAEGFASADGDVDTDQIRDCVGEIALERDAAEDG